MNRLIFGFCLSLVSGAALLFGTCGTSFARSFYLSKNVVQGNQALTACQPGYHMASLYEIIDPSNLTYNTALGRTSDDSGSGPPDNTGGWIRTGFSSSHDTTPGQGNCDAWTSNSVSDHGAAGGLNADWASSATVSGPWSIGGATTCSSERAVWCMQDVEDQNQQ